MSAINREIYDGKGNLISTETITIDDAPILKAQAQSALDKSDKTILRCYENSIDVPAEWTSYRVALRAIVSSGTGSLPSTPSYPSGT